MALGRKVNTAGALFVATADLRRWAGHPFYGALNRCTRSANLSISHSFYV